MNIVAQVAVLIFGGMAIWLVGRTGHVKKWGYIFGLCSQPFWVYIFISTGQYLMLPMTAFYAFSWAMGVYNYWIKK